MARYRTHLDQHFYTQKCLDPTAKICSIHFGLLADSTEQRRAIVRELEDNGIETRIFSAGNLGLHPFWYERYGKASFPMADRIHTCGLFLPNHPSMSAKDVDDISEVVLNAACAPKS